MIAFDKQKRRRLLLFQAPVAGQDQAILCPRRSNQAVTGQVRPINHILADDAEPLDEPAEHVIGGEFYIRHGQLSSILIDPVGLSLYHIGLQHAREAIHRSSHRTLLVRDEFSLHPPPARRPPFRDHTARHRKDHRKY